ncbi:MAG: hypothetical protein P8Z38_01305 [Robiginitalea sp.]
MKKLKILLVVPLLMAFQCDEETDLSEDRLIDTGLLGRWEIADETIGGISDLSVKCCRFFEFNPDDTPEDFKGTFFYEDATGVYQGVFSVDPENGTILFQRESRNPVTYVYALNGEQDYLRFTFAEDDTEFEQGWSRVY